MSRFVRTFLLALLVVLTSLIGMLADAQDLCLAPSVDVSASGPDRYGTVGLTITWSFPGVNCDLDAYECSVYLENCKGALCDANWYGWLGNAGTHTWWLNESCASDETVYRATVAHCDNRMTDTTTVATKTPPPKTLFQKLFRNADNSLNGESLSEYRNTNDSGVRALMLEALPTGRAPGRIIATYEGLGMDNVIPFSNLPRQHRQKVQLHGTSCNAVDSYEVQGENTCSLPGSVPDEEPLCKDGTCGGDPISLVDGSVHLAEEDPLPRGTYYSWMRNYDSSQPYAGAFGRGWTSIFDSWLRTYGGTDGLRQVIIETPNGDDAVFAKISGQYKQVWPRPRQGTLGREIDNGVDVWTYTPSGSNATFRYEAASGRLLSYRRSAESDFIAITYANDAPSSLTTRNWSATITTDPTTKVVTEIAIDQQPALRWIYHYSGEYLMRVALPTGENWRRYEYTDGRLTSVFDGTEKNLHTWAYDATGRAQSGSDATEAFTSIQYGLPGREPGQTVTRTTSGTGAVVDHHILMNSIRPRFIDTVGASCASCAGETSRAYNLMGTLIREQDNRGYITEYSYDSQERLVRVLSTNLRPADCDPATAVDHCRLAPEPLLTASLTATAATTTTRYEYNDPLWPTKSTDTFAFSIAQPSAEIHESRVLDPATGRVVQTTRTGWTGDPLHEESRTTFTILYDGVEGAAFDPGPFFDRAWLALPQPKSAMKQTDGSRTDLADVSDAVYYPIDASVPMSLRGRLAARRNAAGHITQWTAYDVWGNATRVVDPNGVATEFTFDQLGRPLNSTTKGVSGCSTADDPLCATDLTTSNVYASVTGPLAEVHAAGGGVTAYEYDDRGRVFRVGRGPTPTDLRERIEYTYDPTSGKKTVEKTLANVSGSWIEKKRETFGYDTEGRLTTITHADGTSIAYDYLSCGLMSGQRDENHTTWNTTYEYDAGGRLAVVRQALATAPGGWIETRYIYDTAGNLIAVTDPNGNTTTYQYDDFGQMLRQTSPVTGVTTYAYDPAGNLLATTDANSATTARTYDALGRVLTATSSKAGAPTEVVTWSYDDPASGLFGIGRLASMTDPTGSTTYAYTRRGQLRTEAKTIRGATYATGFGYDADGNRSRLVLPSGRVVDYGFDYAGRPVTASTGATPLVTAATYLPFGPATEIRYGNGTIKTSSFDSRYRIETNALSGPAGAIASYDYDHDDAGNITAIRDLLDPGYDRGFGYDDINRLTTANSGAKLWGPGSYQYDAMGNMQSLALGTHRTASFSYVGTTPKLAQVVENGTPSSVAYDAVGNEIAVGATTSGYSARNHMTSYGTSTFEYDGRGIRTITTSILDLAAVTVATPTITGGLPVSATVALTGTAPGGGAVVALTSSTPQLQPPATVTIPAGQTSVTIEIPTAPVATDEAALLTATWDTTSREASIQILAPVVQALALEPSTLHGGSSVSGTITLTGPSAAGGRTVTMTTTRPDVVAPPPSITVDAGTSAAGFAVPVTPVETQTNVTITASATATDTQAAVLVVEPPLLTGVTVTPSIFVGGETATVGAAINAPAPAAGTSVVVDTSDHALAPVPPPIVIPAGGTAGQTTLGTAPVTATTPVVVAGTLDGITRSTTIALEPPPVTLTNLTLAPASLVGSNDAVGTITLSGPAPAGGVTVALQSSNTNAALVPATALVAEGQTAATFPIETKVVTATTSVTISATYGVTSRTATLTVQAPAGNYPSQLTITPTTLVGGTAASGTVTMKTAAASNLTVALTSSDPTVASVPASVTIARKKTQATFTVTTFSVATQTDVTITASYGGVIQRVQLTVNPQQGASFEAPESFGNGAERVARCASLVLTPCLMSAALPREIASTVGIEQSRYNLYTPELTLLAESETTAAAAKAIAWEYVFFGGEPMAQFETATGEMHWYFTDHLGTPVVTTDGVGTVDWSVEREPYGLGVTTTSDRRQPLSFPGQDGDSARPLYNIFRWYRPAWAAYSQADPIGLTGGVNVRGYASQNPVRFLDPFGLRTCLIVTINPWVQVNGFWVGDVSHAAIYFDGQCRGNCGSPGNNLFDPGGTYLPPAGAEPRPWGSDVITNPDIEDYRRYHESGGDLFFMYCFETSCCEEQEIFERISGLGAQSGGTCVFNVADSVRGVGPFQDAPRWPGPFSRWARRLYKKVTGQ